MEGQWIIPLLVGILSIAASLGGVALTGWLGFRREHLLYGRQQEDKTREMLRSNLQELHESIALYRVQIRRFSDTVEKLHFDNAKTDKEKAAEIDLILEPLAESIEKIGSRIRLYARDSDESFLETRRIWSKTIDKGLEYAHGPRLRVAEFQDHINKTWRAWDVITDDLERHFDREVLLLPDSHISALPE